MIFNTKKFITIIIASIVLSFIYNAVSPFGLSIIRKDVVVNNVSSIDYGDDRAGSNVLNGVEFSTMAELVNDKRVTIIDARDQWEYNEGHLPGAVNIPEFSFDANDETVTSLNKANVYVIYCEGDDCDVSKRLANELIKLGFTKVYVYLGGYAEWVERNMQVEVSK